MSSSRSSTSARARVVAFEALARGPAGPLEPPDALFAAARTVGLLAELDEACRSAAFAGASRLGPVAPHTVFVNVEPEVLDSAPLSELLTIADAAPGELRVVLEITERALAARPAELLRTVERVRDLGWGVALDDVGADSASLALMALLRPDVVKLDLSLVQDRPSPAVAEIMHTVNAYAERSGALVLAEGIETDRHLAAARALGATSGQGWCSVARPPTRTRPLPCAPSTCPSSTASPTGRRSSPFACLPADVVLRRSSKRLLIELSKQLEREALRLGETCVVASTFQHRRHFTPTPRPLPRPGRADRLRLRARRGPPRRTGSRSARRAPRGRRPGAGRVGHRGAQPALQHRPAGPRPRRLGPGPGPQFEYALTYRPRHRHPGRPRAAVPGGPRLPGAGGPTGR